MSELYVIIANWGRGQQTVYPRNETRGDRPGFGNPDKERPGSLVGVYTEAEADEILADLSVVSSPWHRGSGSPHYHKKPLRDAHKYAQGLAGNLIRQVQGMMRESKMIKIKKSDLAKMIREAHGGWGEDEYSRPDYEGGEDHGLAASEYTIGPAKKSADQDFRRYETDAVYAELVDLLDDIASPGWIKWNLEDGLTKDEIIARAKRGEARSKAWMKEARGKIMPDFEPIRDDGPNPPSAFPIRVGWSGGSFDARDDEELDMIIRDLVSKGIAYSVDSVSELEPEISVGSSIEQYAEGIESLQTGKIRIKKSKLIDLIREAFEIINAETGELMPDPESPERMFNTLKRLGITPTEEGMPGAEEVYLSGDDWDKYYDESAGKTHARRNKRELERLDAKNLMKRLDQWAAEAGRDYSADNPSADMEGVARDLAAGAKYSFEPDEWDELLTHFDINMDHDDSRTAEDALIDYIADTVASQVSEGKIRVKKSDLRKFIRESLAQNSSDKDIAAAVLPLAQAQDWPKAAELLLSIFSYADLQNLLDDSTLSDALENVGVSYDDKREIETAAWPLEDARMQAAIAADPDKAWLKFLGNEWTSQIEPDDMKGIKWKEYKRYVRLKPPYSISHGVGEINVTRDNVEGYSNSPGTYEEFIEFLGRRAGDQLGKRKPYRRSPAPYYD